YIPKELLANPQAFVGLVNSSISGKRLAFFPDELSRKIGGIFSAVNVPSKVLDWLRLCCFNTRNLRLSHRQSWYGCRHRWYGCRRRFAWCTTGKFSHRLPNSLHYINPCLIPIRPNSHSQTILRQRL